MYNGYCLFREKKIIREISDLGYSPKVENRIVHMYLDHVHRCMPRYVRINMYVLHRYPERSVQLSSVHLRYTAMCPYQPDMYRD